MLGGKPTVFVSCSERFKATVAAPIKEKLTEAGINAIIVSDEPLPLGAIDWTPEAKVDFYITGSDAVVALCTPDDELADGTKQTRQNIINEIQRARSAPHLRGRTLVLKARDVRLPSNINPTYESLAIEAPLEVVPSILKQLTEWGVLAKEAAAPQPVTPEVGPSVDIRSELVGIDLGDHEKAQRRAYLMMHRNAKAGQRAAVESLVQELFDATGSTDNTYSLVVANYLEAVNRLDPSLIGIDTIERMAMAPDFSIRSSAANLLWDTAKAVPGLVPLDVLGRLARPGEEDWYVSAPAMAAVKTLVLVRDDAYSILEALAASESPDDRAAVASALADIAHIDPAAVRPGLLARLLQDEDDAVVRTARRAHSLAREVTEEQHRSRYYQFGL
jgi:hypothetical protein